jgi:hypothetical protein
VVTLNRAVLVRSIAGQGSASGRTFVAPRGFLAVEYQLHNAGRGELSSALTIYRLFGLVGDFGGTAQPAGTFDPPCVDAASSFAAAQHLADPAGPVRSGQSVSTVAVYPLPRYSAITPYVMSWSSVPLLEVGFPLPIGLPVLG